MNCVLLNRASQMALMVKNLPASAGDIKRSGFNPSVGKIHWRRVYQSTPVFLPGQSHGQRNLAVCSLYGCIELDLAEVT